MSNKNNLTAYEYRHGISCVQGPRFIVMAPGTPEDALAYREDLIRHIEEAVRKVLSTPVGSRPGR